MLSSNEVFDSDAQILERSGGQIFYWLSGSLNRPLVVLTHGSAVNHDLFQPQIDAIGQHYRVLVWDMRGHGRSKPLDKRFSLALAADDLYALIHAAGYQQAVLVGQSMGSYVCQEAIFRYPDIALGFVSIGAGCITLPLPLSEWLRLKIGTLLSPFYPYESLKNPTARMASITPQGQAAMLAAMNQVSAADYVQIMRAVGTGFHAEANYQMRCPVLLTRGAQEYAGLQKQLERWAERDNTEALLVIPEAGHIANYDNPEFFNRALLDFLGKHLPGDLSAGEQVQSGSNS